MQCPRCGLVNQPGITACARCGLPAPRPAAGPGQPPVIPSAAPPPGPDPVNPPWQPQRAFPPREPQAQPYAPPAWVASGAPPGAALGQSGRSGSTGTGALVALVLAALVGLGYAAWALTARRGVFADLGDGTYVSADDARTSDLVDTTLLLVAAIVVLIAVAWWVVRLTRREAAGGPLAMSGLAVTVLGLVTVGVGLLLAGGATDGATQSDQADRAVLATVVIAGGFLVASTGLLLGTRVVARRSSEQEYAPYAPFDYPRT